VIEKLQNRTGKTESIKYTESIYFILLSHHTTAETAESTQQRQQKEDRQKKAVGTS
jgi:hypothetical protein